MRSNWNCILRNFSRRVKLGVNLEKPGRKLFFEGLERAEIETELLAAQNALTQH
jgi:hypothetical protein